LQDHFNEDQYENSRQDGRRLLKWNAVPFRRLTKCMYVFSPSKRLKSEIPQYQSSSSHKFTLGIDVYASEDFQYLQPNGTSVECPHHPIDVLLNLSQLVRTMKHLSNLSSYVIFLVCWMLIICVWQMNRVAMHPG
jgi:hypothetical protein